jgi:hypothetical protein
MTAFLVFTESEPLIVMTSRAAAADGRFETGLTRRGHGKFIAHELPLDQLRSRYGVPFEVIEAEVAGGKDLRILDSDGRHVFDSISFADLGACVRHDSPTSIPD